MLPLLKLNFRLPMRQNNRSAFPPPSFRGGLEGVAIGGAQIVLGILLAGTGLSYVFYFFGVVCALVGARDCWSAL